MKRTFAVGLFVIAVLALMVGPATAGKPSTDGVFNGNGYPSGFHYNLNLIAKKPDFSCPPQQWEITVCPGGECGDYWMGQVVDTCPNGFTCVEHYGKVIFIPREQDDDPITILMESGRKGPKGKEGATTLEVTDWCTESFGDDPAALRLPKDEQGYAVYARITGKPGEPGEPWVHIDPGLAYVQDEEGNDLLLLGLVDTNGVYKCDDFDPEDPDPADPCYLVRTDNQAKGKGGKGVQKAKNITALFTFNGEICYLDATDCEGDCYLECWCCVDTYEYGDGTPTTGDGVYEACDSCVCDPNCVCPDDYCEGDASDDLCYDYQTKELSCRDYTGEDYWIFNIADFVGYLWDIDSSGAYVVKIRFYPLPLNTE